MNTQKQSISELREECSTSPTVDTVSDFASRVIDRLEAAEARIAELQQLMAQGWSQARRQEGQCGTLRRELYRTQMVLEGVSADYGDSPMAIQARPPVDDVSGLLVKRLKRDADRIAELEAAQLRPLPLTHPELEPGMHALVVFEGSCPLGGDAPEDWCIGKDDKAVGWLPLPVKDPS